MKFFSLLAVLLLAACVGEPPAPDHSGRWNIEPVDSMGGRVMWLEVKRMPDGSIGGGAVGFAPGGQLDPITDVRVEDGELRFRTPGRRRVDGEFIEIVTESRATLADRVLEGVTVREGVERRWRGQPAPAIADHDDGSWQPGEPVTLFDAEAEDLGESWALAKPDDWIVQDGILMNSDGAGLLTSREKFWNFRLQIEYRAKTGQNGGIGLRSRYEIQILGDHGGLADKSANGALYSRIPPRVNATLPPEEWQTYDITLIGRDLTVALNGQTLHDKVTVVGATAMATDWREAEPGALTLQGDHGAIEFRKIVMTPLEQ